MGNIEAQSKRNEQTWKLIESVMKPEDMALGTRFLIPKTYLFGTQQRGDYMSSSEKWVKELQEDKQGMLYILQNPSLVVATPNKLGLELYLSDGHHRARYGIRPVVPGLVFSDEIALSIINRDNKERGANQISLDEYRENLAKLSNNAMGSFSSTLPVDKYPRVIRGVFSVSGLSNHPAIKPY